MICAGSARAPDPRAYSGPLEMQPDERGSWQFDNRPPSDSSNSERCQIGLSGREARKPTRIIPAQHFGS